MLRGYNIYKSIHKSIKYQSLYRFSSTISTNPYYILGVDKNAPFDDIKKQYFKLASEYHPDKNKSTDAAKQFITIKEAYELIKKMHGKSVKLDFEGGSTAHRGFESVRPNSDQYKEDFFKDDRMRNDSDYKEWATKAAQDPEAQKFAESFETILEIKDIKFRPDDVEVPDASKRFNLDNRVKNKLLSDGSLMYIVMIVMGLATFFYLLNRRDNKAYKDDMDNILTKLLHVEENEENLLDNREERVKVTTEAIMQEKKYIEYVKDIENQNKKQQVIREKLAPTMRKFVNLSDIDSL